MATEPQEEQLARVPSAASRSSVWFIVITNFLDSVGIGLLIPVMPDVLRRFTSSPDTVSRLFGYFIGVYALMQFIASPVLGTISDRFGRKPILLISLLGAGLDYIFMAIAPTLPLLFIGRIISGLTGASMTVASSYIADISDDANRSSNFGLIGAAWGLGFIAGPLVGGLCSAYGATAPFVIAAALNLLNFAFGLLVLPESLPKHLRRKINLAKLNPLTSIAKVVKPSPIAAFVYVYFLLFLAGNVHAVNWTLYTQRKFNWTTWEVGLSLSFVGVIIAVAQGGLTRIVIPRMGEYRALVMGIVVYGLTFLFMSLATAGWQMYGILLFSGISGATMPALQSILSKSVTPNEQGELQGNLVALGSLAAILAPFLYSELFVAFTEASAPVYFPGAAYMGAAAICFLALAIVAARKNRAA